MSESPVVCVYTPILNEENQIERWVNSASEADVLLMTDTGSSDGSVALARSLGVTVNECRIEPFRFDDARNFCMFSIPRHVDICLQLDADEVLHPGWRKAVDSVSANHNRWSYWLHSDDSGWAKVRRQNMVRLGKGFRWTHPIHEVMSGPASDSHLENLIVEHRPDRSKSRQYVLPMLERWSAADPDDVRTMFYLGREYWYRNDWVNARKTLWAYIKHPKATWGPERSEALLIIGLIDSDPEPWFWKAVAESPRRREPFVRLAQLRIADEEWDRAKALLIEAAERDDEGIYTTQSECWGEAFNQMVELVEGNLK